MTLQSRASFRYLLRYRGQCALAVLGIALGIAIVVAIHATQLAARSAFSDALSGVFGSATHVISAGYGDIDEHWLAAVRRTAPGAQPSPVVQGSVDLRHADELIRLQLVGIDPLSAAGGTGRTDFSLQRLITEPGAVVLNARTATRLEVQAGATLRTGRGRELHVLAVANDATGTPTPPSDTLLADIATAQEILGRSGSLTRIELSTDSKAVVARLRAILPEHLEIQAHGQQMAGARQLTRAFFTNLDALSLLALLVGAFMVFTTMSFLVVQRETLFARLRALGVTQHGLVAQLAGEAVVLGTLGGLLGAVGGTWFAQALAQPMARTLADHYAAPGVASMTLSPGLLLAALALAVSTTLAASLYPLWRASKLPPVAAMSASARDRQTSRALRWCNRAGAASLVVGVLLLMLTERALLAGFAALAALLLAAMLFIPLGLRAILHACTRGVAGALPLPERIALSTVIRESGQVAPAVAALMAATATSVGVALMVSSFRVAVDDWLGQLLRAELYVGRAAGASNSAPLPNELTAAIRREKSVAALSQVRRVASSTSDGRKIRITAYDLPPAARAGFDFLSTQPDAWNAWERGEAVFISEPFAWHHQLGIGQTLALASAHGMRRFPVAGIYRDYGSEQGVVALSWPALRTYWNDDRAHGLGIYPRAGTDLARLKAKVAAAIEPYPTLSVWANAELREQSMTVFDRTFAVTNLLTLIAITVAALGMFNALLAIHLHQARQHAVMRALGWSRGELRRVLYTHTALVAAVAIVFALPVGLAIASLLIEVINVRSFGWSMDLAWHPEAFAWPASMALLAALTATVWPAERALARAPAGGLRYE